MAVMLSTYQGINPQCQDHKWQESKPWKLPLIEEKCKDNCTTSVDITMTNLITLYILSRHKREQPLNTCKAYHVWNELPTIFQHHNFGLNINTRKTASKTRTKTNHNSQHAPKATNLYHKVRPRINITGKRLQLNDNILWHWLYHFVININLLFIITGVSLKCEGLR